MKKLVNHNRTNFRKFRLYRSDRSSAGMFVILDLIAIVLVIVTAVIWFKTGQKPPSLIIGVFMLLIFILSLSEIINLKLKFNTD